MITLSELRNIRDEAIKAHRVWKQGIYTRDLIADGTWSTLWPDDHLESGDPLVENVYVEALEDKVMTGGSTMPKMLVNPTRGTRKDRGERNAQKRRRVMLGYWQRSDIENLMESLYYDYFHTGATYLMPWTDFHTADGSHMPAEFRQPYLLRMDPRHVYPLAHDSKNNLTSALVSRVRRMSDLHQEYGSNHPGLKALEIYSASKRRSLERVEEIWYLDNSEWGIAFADPGTANDFNYYIVPQRQDQRSGSAMEWHTPPEPHGLGACPLVEAAVVSHNGKYRSPLEPVIPHLRVAHNLMARVLDDMSEHIYAPVVLDYIENPEDYGPGAVLEGTGEGKAAVTHSRPPTNFDATQKIIQKLIEARRQARHPEQRQGDPGASIVSDKALHTLQGAFNVELASAQRRVARLLERATERAAAFDEVYCDAEKSVDGIEEGNSYDETYTPTKLFAGDYRLIVSYGSALGLDENASMMRHATLLNMGAISKRTFAASSGAVEDALHEERERGMEDMIQVGIGLLVEQASQGNTQAWQAISEYYETVDSDKTTHRAAIMEAVNKIMAPQPAQGAGPGMPGGNPGDAVEMMRSMSSGGIPGNAEGQPPVASDRLLGALPPGVARAMGEVMPGGTAS